MNGAEALPLCSAPVKIAPMPQSVPNQTKRINSHEQRKEQPRIGERMQPTAYAVGPGGSYSDQSRRGERNDAADLGRLHATSMLSSTRRLSASSVPESSNEFVIAALPFSTLVITYEHPIQCASA